MMARGARNGGVVYVEESTVLDMIDWLGLGRTSARQGLARLAGCSWPISVVPWQYGPKALVLSTPVHGGVLPTFE